MLVFIVLNAKNIGCLIKREAFFVVHHVTNSLSISRFRVLFFFFIFYVPLLIKFIFKVVNHH